MKRWVYLISAVLVVAFLSGKRTSGTDVARLQPVEVVSVARTEGQLLIWTDTGDSGNGEDLGSAIKDLKEGASAEVFLETAEYLLISEGCRDLLPELMDHLRPSCLVCRLEGEPELETVAAYLRIHQPEVTLMEYRAGITELPTLRAEKGRMELVS